MHTATTLKRALTTAKTLFTPHETAVLDAELLLCHVLQCSRAYLYTHPEHLLTDAQWKQYQHLIAQRHEGNPVAYLLGERAWWSMTFAVSPATLIPRPETELLLECILTQHPAHSTRQVLELGTGSGILAIALAHERPTWSISACDLREETLALARQNLSRIPQINVHFFQSDWFSQVPATQRFDLILSNPPYLSDNDPHLTQGDLRFEPLLALSSGPSGLEALSHLIQQSIHYLLPHGQLFVEHGQTQGAAVHALFKAAGYQDIRCWKDFSGHDRVTQGTV